MYMCVKISFKDLNPAFPPTPHKHLYFWSDHDVKEAWWYIASFYECVFIWMNLFLFLPYF